MYKIRAILDTQEDIIRTILVDDTINLEKLHIIIAKSFGFEGHEMASFYRADEDWNQGEEIPLFNMAEADEDICMENCILNETLPEVNDKLIYVYDFLNMWTFYLDVVEISDEKRSDLPKTILAVGDVPSEAPEKQFTADDFEDDFEEFGDDDMIDEEFDSFDDIEYPEY